jgi:hypothetical protein
VSVPDLDRELVVQRETSSRPQLDRQRRGPIVAEQHLRATRGLEREELRRVIALGPSITRELDREASDLIESVLVLLAMHPQDAALWLRANLAAIEARLAS